MPHLIVLFLITLIAVGCDSSSSGDPAPSDNDCRQEAQACAEGFVCTQLDSGSYSCAPDAMEGGVSAGGLEAGAEPMAGVEGGSTPLGGEAPVAGVEPVAGEEPVAGVESDAPCADSATGCPELEWVTLEGGDFRMGSSSGELDEQPVHSVAVPTFQIMRTEVTVGMYRACFDAGACSALSTFSSACTWSMEATDKELYPANCMTWFQLKDFATWVGARLPSEAEWEFAARGRGRDVTYPWGEAEPSCELSNFRGCGEATDVVCAHPNGNTPEGLCDMAGNVWEWVQDEYNMSYTNAPADGSAWCSTEGCEAEMVSDPFRVMRGGYWSGETNYLRTTYRSSASPIVDFGFRGGRLARSPR